VKRFLQIVGGLVVLVIAIAAISSIGKHGGGEPASAPDNAAADAVVGRVDGVFRRDCPVCDHRLVAYVRTSGAWCGWSGGEVVVHVRMRNTSAEHLTVDWHPSYVIENGGEHGAGLSSLQSDGFDAGETRDLLARQSPKGVAAGSPIETCKPSFSDVRSG